MATEEEEEEKEREEGGSREDIELAFGVIEFLSKISRRTTNNPTLRFEMLDVVYYTSRLKVSEHVRD